MSSRAAALLVMCVGVVSCSSGVGSSASTSRVSLTPTPSPAISTEWTEYHRDAGRSGLGPAEPAIGSPVEAWRAAVDGDVYASPLIVAGHVIVATENNTVYSLDLFTGSVVWKAHLGDPVDASTLPCGGIRPVTGITSTPVADTGAGRVYVVAFLRGYHHVMYSLRLLDGSVAFQRPVDPVGSNPVVQQQRGALSMGSGFVYVPFGGLLGDCGAYRGYVVGISLDGVSAVAYVVPTPRGAGIWSPMGATIGPDGTVYVVTGNATSAAGNFGYSDTVLALSPDLSSVRSYFAPSNWAFLNSSDTDLGSVGLALLPGDLALSVGKEGVAYLLRASSLGGVGGQIASRRVCGGAWGGTAWAGSTVFVPCADGLFALSVTSSSIGVAWSAGSVVLGSPIVSAGAVWAIEPSSGSLFALDPASGRVLYRAGLGAAQHFSTPAATDGFVVVPAGQKVVAVSVVSS
ncbi:MAG TPA: PQQ-binding-like beta-propeller repeat protein [Candidatus Dormibacteraeota bacterium]|nr:PQQ-binding-like beta-propeller repeat protein [Candidatus Dormibacteraeota bacterium]